jgi:hypothetical protein
MKEGTDTWWGGLAAALSILAYVLFDPCSVGNCISMRCMLMKSIYPHSLISYT